jgi:effector-binding domain-containing protein
VEYVTDLEHMSDAVASAFDDVIAALRERGEQPEGAPFSLYDEPSPRPDGTWHVYSGFPAHERQDRSPSRAQTIELPGGTVAVATHVGPYETIDQTYSLLLREIDARGFARRGPMWESYLTDPQREPDPARWQTEVHVPVEPAPMEDR